VTERSDGAVPAGSTRRGAERGGPRLKRRFRSDAGAKDTTLEPWPGLDTALPRRPRDDVASGVAARMGSALLH